MDTQNEHMSYQDCVFSSGTPGVNDVRGANGQTHAIYAALIAVQRELGAIGCDKKHDDKSFAYRSTDVICNRVHPLLARHGIVTAQRVLNTDYQAIDFKHSKGILSRVKMEYLFFATDGSSVSVTAMGEASDTSDGGLAKAQTHAHKTALEKLFCIPYTDHDPDTTLPTWLVRHLGMITLAELNALKKLWFNSQTDCDLKNSEACAKGFASWVVERAESVQNCHDPRAWDRESYDTCMATLTKEQDK